MFSPEHKFDIFILGPSMLKCSFFHQHQMILIVLSTPSGATPPTTFLKPGVSLQAVVWMACGRVSGFGHSLAILASGAVLWKGGEAVEAAPRKAADEAAEASKIAP